MKETSALVREPAKPGLRLDRLFGVWEPGNELAPLPRARRHFPPWTRKPWRSAFLLRWTLDEGTPAAK